MNKQIPKMQPYQEEALSMITSVPEGVNLKVALPMRGRARVYVTVGDRNYIYHGNGKWRKLSG